MTRITHLFFVTQEEDLSDTPIAEDEDVHANYDRSYPDIRQRRFEQQLRSAGQTVEHLRESIHEMRESWDWGVPDGQLQMYDSRATSPGEVVVDAGWMAPW
jgi:hypothetical protein